MHLLASRISSEIGPNLVVESNRVDDKRVAFPVAHRVSEPTRVRIFGERAPVCPNRAPDVQLLEEHKRPARNLDDFERVGKNQKLRRSARLTVQRRAVFLPTLRARPHQRLRSVELRLPPGSQRRASSIVDPIHARKTWFGAVRVLHPYPGQIVGKMLAFCPNRCRRLGPLRPMVAPRTRHWRERQHRKDECKWSSERTKHLRLSVPIAHWAETAHYKAKSVRENRPLVS